MPTDWRDLVGRIPEEPGIYLMKDRRGDVFYVGKAANLRARVRSYFTSSGDTRAFVKLLDSLLHDIETIVVDNETEALILENNLIKRYRPRFNVLLRDDKNFLVLRIDTRARFPRIELVRRVSDDGARYFGPYPSARSVRELVSQVDRAFGLRTCTDHTMATRTRPCLQHEMGRCSAPCVGLVSPEEYREDVRAAIAVLEGRSRELVDETRRAMEEAAAKLEFETAARLRDRLHALERAYHSQRMVIPGAGDLDVHGVARAGDRVALATMFVRHGMVWGQYAAVLEGMTFPDEEVVSQYINLFYDTGVEVPPKVLVPMTLEDSRAKAGWLSRRAGRRVEVVHPRRGDLAKLLALANKNASAALVTRRGPGESAEALERLGELVGAPVGHLECADISAFHGDHAVGAVAAFVDGRPEKARYRRYRIKVHPGRSDDFAMMEELLTRRLTRGLDEGDLPDLLLVDGGAGQVNVATRVMERLGIHTVLVAGIAKARARKGTDERLVLPGKAPIPLRAHTPERMLLERIRDEAHRFAIEYHRRLRARRTLTSDLDSIPGVGPSRRRQLLEAFGSIQGVRAASMEDLTRLPGIGPSLAKRILEALGRAP